MNNGLYTAFLGMRARQRSLDVIASNIANANTTGFKADALFYDSFEGAQQQGAGQQNVNAQANAGRHPAGGRCRASHRRTDACGQTGCAGRRRRNDD